MFSKKKEKKEKVKEEKRIEKALKESSKENKKKSKKRIIRTDSSSSSEGAPSNMSGYSQGSSGNSGHSHGAPNQNLVCQPGLYPNLPIHNGHVVPFQTGMYPVLPNQNGYVSNPASVISSIHGAPLQNGYPTGYINQNGYGQFIAPHNGHMQQSGYSQEQNIQDAGKSNHKYGAKNLHLIETDEKERKSHRKRDKSNDKSERKRDKSGDRTDKKRDKSKDKTDKKREKSKERSDKRRDKSKERSEGKKGKTDDKNIDKKKGQSKEKIDKKRDKSKDRENKEKRSYKADKKAAKKENEKTDKKAAKKSDKKSDKSDKKSNKTNADNEKLNGILKKPNDNKSSSDFIQQGMGLQYTSMHGGQVTFAGPDNRVHQSVINVQQPMVAPPDVLPNNYQSNVHMPQGYVYNHPNQNPGFPAAVPDVTSAHGYPAATTYAPQQFNGNHITPPHPHMNVSIATSTNDPRQTYTHTSPMQGHTPVHHVSSEPYAVQRGSGQAPHIATIDISSEPYVRNRSPSPGVTLRQPLGLASAQGGTPVGNAHHQQYAPPAQHNKGAAPPPPFVLAEVNVPENAIPQNQQEAYAKFDTLVKKARNDEITYAQLLFDRQNTPVNAKNIKTLQKDNIANYVIEMDSDEENEHPLRHKGILKQPKRVEFNKDVDVTLFGTLNSRHESLESLWYPDPHVAYRKTMDRQRAVAQARLSPQVSHQPVQYVHAPPPPSYMEVVQGRPLDDTDLLMYTMRRRRPPPMPRAFFDGTLRAPRRHSSLRLSGRGRPPMRPVRVLPVGHPLW